MLSNSTCYTFQWAVSGPWCVLPKFWFNKDSFLYLFNFLTSDYEVEFSVPDYCDCVVIFTSSAGKSNSPRFRLYQLVWKTLRISKIAVNWHCNGEEEMSNKDSICILQLPPGTFWPSQPHSTSFCIIQLPPGSSSHSQGLPATFLHSQPHSASFSIILYHSVAFRSLQ